MKSPIILIIVFFLFTALSGCASGGGKEVLAVEKTGTYHRPECPLVHMAKTKPMSVDRARAEHLKPCPGCKPDTV